jgi:uncharacterized protein (UPF0248 family)
MRKHPLNDLLNRIKWKGGGRYRVEVRERSGAVRTIDFGEITKIASDHFDVGEAYIPYHRVKRVVRVMPEGYKTVYLAGLKTGKK